MNTAAPDQSVPQPEGVASASLDGDGDLTGEARVERSGTEASPMTDGGAVPGSTEARDDESSDDESSDDEPRDEADIAGDFLEELLDIADIDGDFDIEERGGRVIVAISADGEGGESLSRLGDPETVDALQQLTRLAVQAETGEFSRLILDVAGSRDARRGELDALVATAVERLDEGAASASLPPMSSYERKIVHDLAAEHGCTSESEGEGRDRHPVLRRQ